MKSKSIVAVTVLDNIDMYLTENYTFSKSVSDALIFPSVKYCRIALENMKSNSLSYFDNGLPGTNYYIQTADNNDVFDFVRIENNTAVSDEPTRYIISACYKDLELYFTDYVSDLFSDAFMLGIDISKCTGYLTKDDAVIALKENKNRILSNAAEDVILKVSIASLTRIHKDVYLTL